MARLKITIMQFEGRTCARCCRLKSNTQFGPPSKSGKERSRCLACEADVAWVRRLKKRTRAAVP